MSENPAEPTNDALADEAAELIRETNEQYQQNREEQHELLKAVAEEDGAPLLETQCEIYDHVVPVSGRLTGGLMERFESLDDEIQRRQDGDDDARRVSAIIRELTEELSALIDDGELTADELYQLYRREGGEPLRTIADNVIDALKREDERERGTADGFREEPGSA